ncbi:Gfo/Idh/MocA family oxidoreductase [Saccharopolyspora sp. NPDC002686]|uniref:Gfo/Idh/MocA family protein n=1 Tax=Saccharopolyspora sp. NPDC002686 TaxID=3154541 RepID=UPI00332C2B3A
MDVRTGVLGCGLRVGIADHAHQPGAGSRIVAVCDPDPARAEAAAQRYGDGVRTTSTLDELLECGLDAVFVVSPDHLHEEHAIRCLEAGLAVYLEKPLAITAEGCDRVLTAAQQHGGKLYVGHNMRHMPVVRTMRDLIVSGAIGRVTSIWCRHFVGHGGDFYFKDWHADRSKSTGLLLQKGAHDIDVLHWLAGGYSRRVNAMGALTVYGGITDRNERETYKTGHDWDEYEQNWPPLSQTGLNPVVDVEDLSMVNLQLDNGVLATYQQCHYTPDYWRNYTVIGTEGRLENFGDGSGAVVKVWNRRHRGYAPDGDQVVEVERASGGHGGADPRIVAEFLDFVRADIPTVTSPIAAREAVATGCAATESLRNGGKPVDVTAPDAALLDYFEHPHASAS